MEIFDYVAITPDNKEEKGKIEAESRDDAYKQLYARGLYVSTLKANNRDIEKEVLGIGKENERASQGQKKRAGKNKG